MNATRPTDRRIEATRQFVESIPQELLNTPGLSYKIAAKKFINFSIEPEHQGPNTQATKACAVIGLAAVAAGFNHMNFVSSRSNEYASMILRLPITARLLRCLYHNLSPQKWALAH